MTWNMTDRLNGSCCSTDGPSMVSFDTTGRWTRPLSHMASKKIFSTSKRKARIFKAVWPHVLLIVLLVIYIFGGAVAFLYLERPTEIRLKRDGVQSIEKQKLRLRRFVWASLTANSDNETIFSNNSSLTLLDIISDNNTTDNVTSDEARWRQQFDTALNEYTRIVLRAAKENFVEHGTLFEREKKSDHMWSFPAAILFAFSCVTTIGYGNIAPVTFRGRLFCIFYGLVGIPFAMLVLANVGKFLSEGLQYIVLFCKRIWKRLRARFGRYDSKTDDDVEQCSFSDNEMEKEEEIDRPLPFVLLIALGAVYIFLGAVLLPKWESLSFFDAFYFSFVTITTTGFGDLVPQRYNFLIFTLIYVAVGIAMITMCIEAMAAYMRKLHYVGRRIQGAKFTRIRFGDKNITLDELITSVGVKFGVSALEIARLKGKLDAFVTATIETRQMSEPEKVTALAAFDLNGMSNGGVTHFEKEEEIRAIPLFFELSTNLRSFLGPFNMSAEDIRYIDDDQPIETRI